MATDGKIYITISDERLKGSSGGTIKGDDKKEDEKESEATQFSKHQFQNFIVSEAKKMANYTISNIGNFTGDYTTQRSVNAVVNIVGKVGSLVTATKAAGLPGLIIASATMLTTDILGEVSASVENKKQNAEINRLRNISGLNNLTNGSR